MRTNNNNTYTIFNKLINIYVRVSGMCSVGDVPFTIPVYLNIKCVKSTVRFFLE